MSLISLLVSAVLYCAVFRAIIHPQEGRFAYLRVGAPELFLVVLAIAAGFVLFFAVIVGALLVGLIAAALTVMHAAVGAVILAALAGVAAAIAIIWLALRFSMVGPMTVSEGKFRLFESWTLTRGHAGVLFVMALCIFAILIVAQMLVGGVLMVAGVTVLSSAAGGTRTWRAISVGRRPLS